MIVITVNRKDTSLITVLTGTLSLNVLCKMVYLVLNNAEINWKYCENCVNILRGKLKSMGLVYYS